MECNFLTTRSPARSRAVITLLQPAPHREHETWYRIPCLSGQFGSALLAVCPQLPVNINAIQLNPVPMSS